MPQALKPADIQRGVHAREGPWSTGMGAVARWRAGGLERGKLAWIKLAACKQYGVLYGYRVGGIRVF